MRPAPCNAPLRRRRLLRAGVVLLVPLLACARSAASTPEDIEGRWTLSHRKPGVVEVETVQLLVRKGEGRAVSAEVSIPGVVVPFTGTFDPDTGRLSLIAHKGSESATIDLVLRDGHLDGTGDLPIGQLTFQGLRTVGEPEVPVRIALDGQRPSEALVGDLPPALARGCAKAIEDMLREHDVVGLSMALVADGAVIEVLSSGWQDHEQGVAASARTMYRWASVSKPLTAVAALQLAASGELDLHADLRGLVPEYDKGVVMTPFQLLAHEAGLPHTTQADVRTVKEYDAPHPWVDRIVALDMFIESDLAFSPGYAFCYSTPGYVLLGAVIERAGRKPYAEQVLERICVPLGMTTMRPDYIWEEIPDRGLAYQTTDLGPQPTAWDDISWKLPAGGWISTAGDMGRFAIGVMGSELLDAERQALMQHMRTDYGDGKKGYGLGLNVASFSGRRVIYHGGGQVGASSFLVCSPDTGHAVAVLSNTEGIDLSDLAFQVLSLVVAEFP